VQNFEERVSKKRTRISTFKRRSPLRGVPLRHRPGQTTDDRKASKRGPHEVPINRGVQAKRRGVTIESCDEPVRKAIMQNSRDLGEGGCWQKGGNLFRGKQGGSAARLWGDKKKKKKKKSGNRTKKAEPPTSDVDLRTRGKRRVECDHKQIRFAGRERFNSRAWKEKWTRRVRELRKQNWPKGIRDRKT